SNATTGGIWSSSNTAAATIDASSGVVHGVAAGSTNISYTAGSCAVGVTMAVSAGVSPISGPSTVCAGTTIALSNATTGGAWSSSNTAAATIDASTGVVYGVASGTTNISYTSGACAVGMAVTVINSLSPITGPTT